ARDWRRERRRNRTRRGRRRHVEQGRYPDKPRARRPSRIGAHESSSRLDSTLGGTGSRRAEARAPRARSWARLGSTSYARGRSFPVASAVRAVAKTLRPLVAEKMAERGRARLV